MTTTKNSTPLVIHTLETLCDELVSGRAVSIDEEGTLFQFTTSHERSIFEWYRTHREKWNRNVMKPDVESIADAIKNSPPDISSQLIDDQGQENKIYKLKSVRAHRFAGVHRYKDPDNPPEEFYFEFDKSLYVVEGMNGSGKTSLLSAICWCLSGYIYRSQRPPEDINQYVRLEIDGEEQENNNTTSNYNMTPITPIPTKQVLTSLGGANLPLDTWVELKLEDEEGHEVSLKRSIGRTSRGKIEITEPDLTVLNIDPIALEIGTKMTGLIPYIQLEEVSDLGQAVAAMTGLKPLRDLARHAEKVQTKLQKELTKDRNDEIKKFQNNFIEHTNELSQLTKENPLIESQDPLPKITDEVLNEKLDELTEHYENLQKESLSKCKMILGESFDAEDEEQRKNLLKNVKPALGQIDTATLARLPSANKTFGELGRKKSERYSETY